MDQDYSHAHLIEAALKVIDAYMGLPEEYSGESPNMDVVALQSVHVSACSYLATLFDRATLDTEI